MTSATLSASPTHKRIERWLGVHHGSIPGPTIVALGGIHGNELGGVYAIQRLLSHLESNPEGFRGTFIGIAGNLKAIHCSQRFIDQDLNRMWLPSVQDSNQPDPSAEREELRDLRDTLNEIIDHFKGPVTVIDLHSFSAHGSPFAIAGDTPLIRELTKQFPVPVVMGLHSRISGTLVYHLEKLGFQAMAFEGGQHDDPATIENLDAFLRLLLQRNGNLDEHTTLDLEESYQRLEKVSRHMPGLVKVHYRYRITPHDQFVMVPGFKNFDKVKKGQLLAHDQRGDIFAPEDARILMPLYQGQGEDGFFLGAELD